MIKKLLILLMTSLFLAACGGGKTEPAVDYAGKLTAKIKTGAMTTEKIIELNEKKGIFESFKSSVGYKSQQVDVIFHQITIGNFDFKGTGMSDEPTQKGQTMVKITLFADKGAKESDAIKVGTYEAFKAEDVANAYLKVSDVSIINFDESKDSDTIGSQAARTGSVKIESVENNIIKGTIDLSAGDSKKISGNFTATLMKK